MSPRDIFVKAVGTSLLPFDNYGRQQILDLRAGKRYRVKPVLSRSLPLHRKYWAMLSNCVKNTWLGDRYPQPEILHDVVMRDLGYVEYYPSLDGEKPDIEIRKSSSFDNMDQIDFEPLFANVALVLSSVLGIDATTLRRQADAA